MKRFSREEIEAMRAAHGGRDLGAAETVADPSLARRFWAKLRQVSARIPFAQDLVAAYCCASDPQTPARVKLILMGAIAYFILPTDAVADFLPLIGFADDAAVLAAAISQVAGSITPAHREEARRILDLPAVPAT